MGTAKNIAVRQVIIIVLELYTNIYNYHARTDCCNHEGVVYNRLHIRCHHDIAVKKKTNTVKSAILNI